MYDYTQDTDSSLAEFVNDYIEGTLDKTERLVFEEYLSANKELASFVKKSTHGRQTLRNTFQVKAADDFEAKLAKRIAEDAKKKSSHNSADLASA